MTNSYWTVLKHAQVWHLWSVATGVQALSEISSNKTKKNDFENYSNTSCSKLIQKIGSHSYENSNKDEATKQFTKKHNGNILQMISIVFNTTFQDS